MKKLLRFLPLLLVAALLAPVESAEAQDLHESRRLSPVGLARTIVGDAYVKVHYGQPYIRNRTVFGMGDDALVPYGQVWRTGANEGTEITTTEDIMVGGEMLPAGTYTLFTMPGETEWAVHFSPQLNLWATGRLDRSATPMFERNVYDPEQDVLRVSAEVMMLDEEVDPFTIELEAQDDGSVHMIMSWAQTSVRVPLEDA
jgi:hypothetical protein